MVASSLLLLLADEAPTPELLKVAPGLAFWTFVAFGLVMWILSKYAWPAITDAMETREDKNSRIHGPGRKSTGRGSSDSV